jgi:uncharacterized cupredoxin-like copper-binding protein
MPLLALAAAATLVFPPQAQAPEPSAGELLQVRVELSNFKIAPASLTFVHGQRYVLHLVNSSSHSHDFSAPAFFSAAAIEGPDRVKITNGKIELHGNQQVDLVLTAPGQAQYEFHCSHPLHAALGMRGTIHVL